MAKVRLDQLLVQRGLCDSREQAKRLILAGKVIAHEQPILKPGASVRPDLELRLKEKPKFVGRGGYKLEGALREYEISVEGRVCLDIGASTGGFTDCLLQHGAEKVFAFDVGTNQLAWKLREDPRVVSREQYNCRDLTPEAVAGGVDLIVIDVSFISLTKILAAAFRALRPQGDLVALIKPQFELEKGQVGRGGIVQSDELREAARLRIERFVTEELNKSWRGVMDSPIAGADGNREFLAWLGHE